jgi:hypothetical protein
MKAPSFRLKLAREGGAPRWLAPVAGRHPILTADPHCAYTASRESIVAARRIVMRRAKYSAKEAIVEEVS